MGLGDMITPGVQRSPSHFGPSQAQLERARGRVWISTPYTIVELFGTRPADSVAPGLSGAIKRRHPSATWTVVPSELRGMRQGVDGGFVEL